MDALFDLWSVENFISEEITIKNYFTFWNLIIEKYRTLTGIGQEELRFFEVSFFVKFENSLPSSFIVLPGLVPTYLLGANFLNGT